jgi:hypothetical protein
MLTSQLVPINVLEYKKFTIVHAYKHSGFQRNAIWYQKEPGNPRSTARFEPTMVVGGKLPFGRDIMKKTGYGLRAHMVHCKKRQFNSAHHKIAMLDPERFRRQKSVEQLHKTPLNMFSCRGCSIESLPVCKIDRITPLPNNNNNNKCFIALRAYFSSFTVYLGKSRLTEGNRTFMGNLAFRSHFLMALRTVKS